MPVKQNSAVIGSFTFTRSTKNFHVFERPSESSPGRTDAQYVPKSCFADGQAIPETIELGFTWKNGG